MGGRGASSNANTGIIRKIVELENKKDSYNIRKYMENNKITLRADTKESVDENVKIVKRTNTAGVFKNNIRIGTIREKSGKWRMT